jgi:hypothetical protein
MSSSRLGVKTEIISSFHQHFIRTNKFMLERCFKRFSLDVRILLRPKKERKKAGLAFRTCRTRDSH